MRYLLLASMFIATPALAQEQVTLKPGPGVEAVTKSCSICHTLNYIRMNSPFLTPDAQVIASIPNVRNLWLISRLISGHWEYEEEGLLDVTHIRFFTKKSVVELFEQTGYGVRAIYANGDGRVPAMEAPPGASVNIDTGVATLKNLQQEDLIELRTLQFVIDATPRPIR